MADDPSQSNPSLEEQFVAYLDGELDAEASRHIDELLASDQKIRQTLHDLERTWDLLEEIDAPLANDQLTKSTLEMVAVAARNEAEQALAERPRRRRRQWLAIAAGVLVTLAGGFFTVAAIAPDPDRQLLKDLPVIERSDEYRQAASLEFLHLLRAKGLFSEKVADDTAQSEVATLSSRQRVQGMNDSEKEQLLRLQQRFSALDPAEQQRLRDLHESLEKDPDAQQLYQTLHQYHQWLRTLPAYGCAELTELEDVQKRVEWIEKRLKTEQAREEEKRLGEMDAVAVLRWMNEFLAKHETALLAKLPEAQRARLEEMNRPDRHRFLFMQAVQPKASSSGKPPTMMTDADLARLREKLTPELRQYLEAQPVAEQWRKVMLAVRLAVRRQPGRRSMHSPTLKADDEHLAAFFEHMPDWERDRLMNLSGEEMHQELLRLYVRAEALSPQPQKPATGATTPKSPAHGKPKPSAGS